MDYNIGTNYQSPSVGISVYIGVIVYGWQKILENITSGFGHHEWKYWIYHEWPKATSDKSNIFTSDDQNHE